MPRYYEPVYYGGQPKSTAAACDRCVYGAEKHTGDCPLGKVKRKIERLRKNIAACRSKQAGEIQANPRL